MSNQVQCPHCGGFKVYIRKKDRVDRKTGRRYGNGEFPLSLTHSSDGFVNFAMLVLFFPLYLALLILMLPSYIAKERQVPADVVWEYSFGCSLCGYQWAWCEGDPLPPVTIQPDLIEKGEQILQEEEARAAEEEERKRRDFIDLSRRLGKQ